MSNYFTSGGQTTLHAIRMFGQVSKKVMLVACLLYTLFVGIYLWQKTTRYQWYLLVHSFQAHLELAIKGNQCKHIIKEPAGNLITMNVKEFIGHQFLQKQLHKFYIAINFALLVSLNITIMVLLGIILFLRYRGKLQTVNQDLRGALFLEAAYLKKFLKR